MTLKMFILISIRSDKTHSNIKSFERLGTIFHGPSSFNWAGFSEVDGDSHILCAVAPSETAHCSNTTFHPREVSDPSHQS